MNKEAFSGVDILGTPTPSSSYNSSKSWGFLISWRLMIKAMKYLKFYKPNRIEFFQSNLGPRFAFCLLRFTQVIRET